MEQKSTIIQQWLAAQDNCIDIIHPGQSYWSVEMWRWFWSRCWPNTTNNVYAIMNQRRFASLDGGVNWTNINDNLAMDLAIRTDYNNPVHVYTTNICPIYESSNNGASWSLSLTSVILPGNVFDVSLSRARFPLCMHPCIRVIHHGLWGKRWAHEYMVSTGRRTSNNNIAGKKSGSGFTAS